MWRRSRIRRLLADHDEMDEFYGPSLQASWDSHDGLESIERSRSRHREALYPHQVIPLFGEALSSHDTTGIFIARRFHGPISRWSKGSIGIISIP